VAAGDLHEPRDDHCDDQRQSRERGRVAIDPGEALVAAVTTKASNRLAAAAEQEPKPEKG
jgi:hypothetical protein